MTTTTENAVAPAQANLNIFEIAARKKLRFDSPKGLLNVEDLWTLPLTSTAGNANLDDIARGLYKLAKSDDSEISFVKPVVAVVKDNETKFTIVKHIIDTRIAERDAAALESARKEQKQKILGMIKRKQEGAMEDLTIEQLEQLAKDL